MPNYDPAMIQALAGPPGSVNAVANRSRLADLFAARRAGQATAAPAGRVLQPSIGERRQQLMAQGMSHADALAQMSKEGLIDPRIVQKILGVTAAVPQ